MSETGTLLENNFSIWLVLFRNKVFGNILCETFHVQYAANQYKKQIENSMWEFVDEIHIEKTYYLPEHKSINSMHKITD